MSDDGQYGLTVIAFLGSVFSPYYAWARRGGGGDPLNHCAVNVALHGPRGHRWAFTERGRGAAERGSNWLRIGPSVLTWDGDSLLIDLDEKAAYSPLRVAGHIRVQPQAMTGHVEQLDVAGRHRWSPMAPSARVEVSLQHPDIAWHGTGYLDTNAGDRPLEDDFSTWHWSRAGQPQGGAAVFYDVNRREGGALGLALGIDAAGTVTALPPPPVAPLPATRWGIARQTRAAPGTARVARTLLDSPFYARSVITTRIAGEDATAVHESLSLDRFRAPWVQAMLPFRIPRRP